MKKKYAGLWGGDGLLLTFRCAAKIEFIIDTYWVDKSPDTESTRILAFILVTSASLVPFAVLFPPVAPPEAGSSEAKLNLLIYANASDNAPAIMVSFVPANISGVVDAIKRRNEA